MSTMRQHAEGHAAAKMRNESITDAELYINRPVCDYVPLGCVFKLADVLPSGTKLTSTTCPRPDHDRWCSKGTGEE